MNRTIHNPILKDTVTFVRTAAETAGAMTELEVVVMPGAVSPAHFHTTYDETITALEGRIHLLLAKSVEVELAPSDSYTIKAGQVHGLRNASLEVVRVRSQIVPGSEGFEDGLRILYGLASDGLYNDRKMPASIPAFSVCLAMSDRKLPGWQSLLNPFIQLIAIVARSYGLEAQLRSRYCK
jgi:quercetin dioxygenase-like cupin family protein